MTVNEVAASFWTHHPVTVPADELVSASRDADLLVVGARGGAQGGGLAQHMPLGSISNKVLHHSECPVVVVPVPRAG